MINLNVYIDDEFYGILNCDNDGDLWSHRMSRDGKFYTYFEDRWWDGGTAHIIEFHDPRFFNERKNGLGFYDFLRARTLHTWEYSFGARSEKSMASRAEDLVAQEWQSTLGHKVVFKKAD